MFKEFFLMFVIMGADGEIQEHTVTQLPGATSCNSMVKEIEEMFDESEAPFTVYCEVKESLSYPM